MSPTVLWLLCEGGSQAVSCGLVQPLLPTKRGEGVGTPWMKRLRDKALEVIWPAKGRIVFWDLEPEPWLEDGRPGNQWSGQSTLRRGGIDTRLFPGASHFLKLHNAVYFGKQGVILSHAHVHSGVHLGSQLAHDDAAG